MQLTKLSNNIKISYTWKSFSVAGILRRSFTKTELLMNQLKRKQLPTQIDFAVLQNKTLKPVYYLVKPEEV